MTNPTTPTSQTVGAAEREKFEEWHGGRYSGHQEFIAFAAWLARAALSTQPAAPASCVPLSDDDLKDVFAKHYPSDAALLAVAQHNRDMHLESIGARHHWGAFKLGTRAIEAAHGIKPGA